MTFNGEQYNYLQAVTDDVKDYITNNINLTDYGDIEALDEYLNDVLWTEDSVTGNASGSYTFSRWEAEENLAHNFDLYIEALWEFGYTDLACVDFDGERADVTIRCYLLSQAIAKALEDLDIVLYFENPDKWKDIYLF